MIAMPSQGGVDLSRHHTPKGRLYQLQQSEEVDTGMSESETTSGEINFEDDSPQEIPNFVRTISRTVTASLGSISINSSYQQISLSLELFHRISNSPPGNEAIHNSVKTSCDKRPEDLSLPPPVVQHSGKLIRRCGDCMSSVITSKILKR
jgi:hypothetical protein